MGQQQLLLVVLGILIVGIAILVGIYIFRANAIEAKRNTITNELINLAGLAQQYYLKPTSMGGGGKSFAGWKIPQPLLFTASGRFLASVSSDNVVITGIGNEVVTDKDSIEVQTTVYADSISTAIIH
ncbi:MAG: hypothetical protein C4539_18950 [Ignavibacteriales bacterium]|nr:MAG: hypothetical protein C4539_18950 [Ignavibacteriales bacterium]